MATINWTNKMEFDHDRLARLMNLSKGRSHDPYERFEWPQNIPHDMPWCNDDLLTTYGTELHDRMSAAEKIQLSKWEAINFFSLNVHGIKDVLEFVSRCIYEKRYQPVSEYLHVFIGEENFHMWYFAKACLDYAGKIYPSVRLDNAGGEVTEAVRELYMFISTLIFEEFVDYYNHKVGTSNGIVDILKQINFQHHVDESRHVSFGREIVPLLYREALDRSDDVQSTKEAIARTVLGMLRYFISLMYNPAVYEDAKACQTLGFANGISLRNALRTHPARRKIHGQWFKRSAAFFIREGIISEPNFATL